MRLSNQPQEDGGFGPSVGDLMAALLLIFVLVVAATLLQLQKQDKERAQAAAEAVEVKKIVELYKQVQDDLYAALMAEFRDDLPKWQADIFRETLIVRFKSPEVLFGKNSYDLRSDGAVILNDFFPRYIQQLSAFEERIAEVRVEGHSSVEFGGLTAGQAYLKNMTLSQGRAFSVLEHVLGIPNPRQSGWWKSKITATGWSSSRPIRATQILKEETVAQLSRRVEFRVMLDLTERLATLDGVAVVNEER
jgi:outer membrane protein OmpA-like peptidoglycan-associated protein